MIIADNSEWYRMITQNDHGDLAGQFAAHWGNQEFARLKPYGSMVLAAEAHDNGWWDWDVFPSVDEQGAPIPFTRTPREFRSTFYGKGIDNVISRDLYAGLIVSMHGVGLTKKRYGTMRSDAGKAKTDGTVCRRNGSGTNMVELSDDAGVRSAVTFFLFQLRHYNCAGDRRSHSWQRLLWPFDQTNPGKIGRGRGRSKVACSRSQQRARRTLSVRSVAVASQRSGKTNSVCRLPMPGGIQRDLRQSTPGAV